MIDREQAPDQGNEEPLESARRETQQKPMQRRSSVGNASSEATEQSHT